MGAVTERWHQLDNNGGELMNASDRLALLIGRLIMQNESKDDALAEKDKTIQKLQEQIEKSGDKSE